MSVLNAQLGSDIFVFWEMGGWTHCIIRQVDHQWIALERRGAEPNSPGGPEMNNFQDFTPEELNSDDFGWDVGETAWFKFSDIKRFREF